MTDDIDPRDMIDEQALLPVVWRAAKLTDTCNVASAPPGEPVTFEIGFVIGKTVVVDPMRPPELRLILSEVDALSLSRAILDVLQGLAHDRIVAMRTTPKTEPEDW